jgi:hypothetical protein
MALLMAMLLLTALLLPLLAGCSQWREIPPPDGEEVYLGQLDRYEVDDKDAVWGVISIDETPYSVSFRANDEINSDITKPGAWLSFSLDGDIAYNVRLAVFA